MANSTFFDGAVPSSRLDRDRTGAFSETRLPTHRHRSGTQAVGRFLRGLADGWEAFRRWQVLDAMSDRQLNQMGLDRRDIARAAAFGTDVVQAR